MEHRLVTEHLIEEPRQWRPGATFALLLSYFALFGAIVGAQGVLWADVMLALHLSKGIFGSAQLVSPLVAVLLLLVGGQLSVWVGKKRLALASLLLLGGSILLLAGARGLVGLIGALLIAGVSHGLLEVAMNGATLDWEQATGRSVMNVMHAGFSGGAVLGAIGAGVLLEVGLGYEQVFVLLAVLCGLSFAMTLPVRYPDATAVPAETRGLGTTLRVLVSQRVLIALALLCLLGVVGESVAILWSVIYLRELGAEAFVGGAAFALFNGAMFVGRLVNAPVVARLGARFSLSASGIGLMLATALLIVLNDVTLAVVALALLGLAVAGVVPTALSVAARLAPADSGAIVGAMMAAAYVCFIIVPPITGWLAELFSLRVALLTVALSGLGIVWLAHRHMREY